MIQVLRRSSVQGVVFLTILLAFIPTYLRAQESAGGARKVVTRLAPNYPTVAYKMEIQGSVKVEAMVSPNATVKTVQVKGGHPMLAQAAQDAVRGWKWEPSPRETRELVEIKFTRQ